MNHTIEYRGMYIAVKEIKTTKEKSDVIKGFFGSDCCQAQLIKDYKCSKCGKNCLSVKIMPEEKSETGSKDMWNLTEIPFNEIEFAEISNWYWLTQGEIKKPKIRGRDIEQLNKYKKQLQNQGQLKGLFLELLQKKSALKGNIIFRRGKINSCYLFPYVRNGYRVMCMAIADGNRELVNPPIKYDIPQKVKVAV